MRQRYLVGLFLAFAAGVVIGAFAVYLALQPHLVQPVPEAPEQPPPQARPAPKLFKAGPLTICSFNIQFLGQSKDRDHASLAKMLEEYDVVLIQELVAPPYPGTFPDGTPFVPDPQAAEFFDLMAALGFEFLLSDEDTGTGDKIHVNSSGTEWWVAFYCPERVTLAKDLPHGFLADDRSNHPDYERVPYAFPFRSADGNCDFVLISVHLKPDSGPAARARRKHEIASIVAWVHLNDAAEKDFLIVGDMNIENDKELTDATPMGFLSLNDECRPTNTNVNGPRPYDHAMYRTAFTSEIDAAFDMVVVDLIEAMRPRWPGPDPFPGDPYDHNTFRRFYSDHHPVVFRLNVPAMDDD